MSHTCHSSDASYAYGPGMLIGGEDAQVPEDVVDDTGSEVLQKAGSRSTGEREWMG